MTGGLPLSEQWIVTNAEGDSLDYREGKKHPAPPQYALCRCGQSGNKPFCDGTHQKVKFDGTETASHEPYLKQAETIDGPTLRLLPLFRNWLTIGFFSSSSPGFSPCFSLPLLLALIPAWRICSSNRFNLSTRRNWHCIRPTLLLQIQLFKASGRGKSALNCWSPVGR